MSADTGRKAAKCVLFSAAALALIFLLQRLLVPKWESDGKWEPVTSMADGFFDEDRNTIDVIYLGSSNAFYDINPLIIYDEYGITGYVLGSGEQRIACSYYYLQEALKRQSPKVVVLDCLSVYASGTPKEEQNRKAYDYMPLSKEKIDSLKENMGKDETLSSYLFPLIRYHGRVWELGERDFTYLFADRHYPYKGYAYSAKTAEGLSKLNMETVLHKNIKFGKKNKTYLQKIKQLCDEKDIRLLLIKTPNIEWGKKEHDKMVRYAAKLEAPFVDYNTFFRELDITEESCFLDGAHLNYRGAEKLSLHLGETVIELMEQVPEHTEKTRQEWETDLAYYEREKTASD